MLKPNLLLASLCLALMTQVPGWAQAPAETADIHSNLVDPNINDKIRKEETGNSQIMRTMHFLADVYGPRLTGSPNHKAAADWAVRQMRSWGLENAHLEPWDFGHPGWVNERSSGYLISPVQDALTFKVLAWTPGTQGVVAAPALQIAPPARPTQEQLTAYLESMRGQVKGKIVLAGKAEFVPVSLDLPPRRLDDMTVAQRYDPLNPNAGQGGNRAAGAPARAPNLLTPRQVDEQLDQFLVASGALLRINDAGREHGQIRAFNNRSYDPAKILPTVVMRNEDYGRIARILADGSPVELEFNIVNHWYPEGKTSYNTIAELPGTDKKDEVIMLGGHLDSWHSATGATDNGIGCAVMMEAIRILKALDVKPRRTIRAALWSGEEEGLLGSQAYVQEHFGTAENPKPEFAKFGGYFNVDAGTGRVRGANVFGPPEDADILRQILLPLADLGVGGAVNSKSRRLGGSDHTSFNQAGLPGIGMGQDPIEYFTNTWHTNLDTYERIIEEDARKSAIVVAAAVYQLAMRDDLLPRFSKPALPKPEPPPAP